MSNFRTPNSYSLVLSALTALSFSFFAAGQTKPGSPPAPSANVRQQESLNRQLKSIAAQQASIERQRAAVGLPASTLPLPRSFAPAGEATAAFDCDPVPPMVLESAVRNAADLYDVEPNLIDAVIRQESGGYPCAVSEKGAMGLMQLMPGTAVEMGAAEPFDVNQNIDAGTRLLAELDATLSRRPEPRAGRLQCRSRNRRPGWRSAAFIPRLRITFVRYLSA